MPKILAGHGLRRLVAATFVGALALATLAGVAARAQSSPPSQTHAVAPGVSSDPANQPDTYGKLPPQKRAEVDAANELRERAAAIARGELPPGPESGGPSPTVQLPDERLPAGAGHIIEKSCRSLFPNSLIYPTNRWLQKETPAGDVLVCGGASSAEPTHGGVIVTYWQNSGSKHPAVSGEGRGRWFPTPTESGSVKIVGATGTVLTLVAQDGATFYFDTRLLAYIDKPE